ncbi:hypothetical protein PIB30_075033 [Stylosanthes scabra]|uniref:Uncharacterized protein n=1 Tax=Stylosanthes scabra TaxID=79078 RepID=A0ABU6YQ58_9FABA|nr:hypothetical protein [Stylosanthes scabra]
MHYRHTTTTKYEGFQKPLRENDDSNYGEAKPNTPGELLRQLSKLELVPEKPEIYGMRIPNPWILSTDEAPILLGMPEIYGISKLVGPHGAILLSSQPSRSNGLCADGNVTRRGYD